MPILLVTAQIFSVLLYVVCMQYIVCTEIFFMRSSETIDTELILENVRKHISLGEEETKLFVSCLEARSVRRHVVLAKAGEVCRHSLFVVEGALKSYTVSNDGSAHVLSFAVDGWWIADMYSLISQRPGVLQIESLANSKLLLLSREKQELLYSKVPRFERFFRILAENALVASQQRIINNLTLTAEERYLHFMEKYPFVLECAPLSNIASYLGMTPEFLSKIRRRLATRSKL